MLPGGFLEGYEIPLAEGCCYDPKLVDPMSTKPVQEFNSRLLDLTKLATTYENHVMISKNKCLYMNAINWRSNTLPHEAKALPSGSSFLEGTRLSGKWRDITKLGLSCEM